jgi:sugar phosphate isomerase/epimerase
MIKLALFTVSYCGFWYKGKALSLKEQIAKAKELGFDGLSIETKRPVALPCDLDSKTRKQIKEFADSEKIKLVAVETMSNFTSPIIEDRESNLCMVQDALKMAADMDIDIVKVFVAWRGTSHYEGLGTYELGRKLAKIKDLFVTQDQMWRWAKSGIRDVAKWARDYGITIAVQNHPPVIEYGYETTLELVREIGQENVKLCLDAPLFLDQSENYIHEAVEACKNVGIVLSHYGSPVFDELPSGEITYERDDYIGGVYTNYSAFIKELKRIGYDGYLESEECAPALENHEFQGVDVAERHIKAALKYMKSIISTGKEPRTLRI